MSDDATKGGGGKKCRKFDDIIICERPLIDDLVGLVV